MARLSDRKTKNDDVSGHTPPVGSIIAYMPGYYSAAANGGGFTEVGLASNTVTACNDALPNNWRVCDGTDINDPESPIWNAVGRHLPEMTDSRFMRGATASGVAGGANSKTLNTPQLPSHSHSGTTAAANAPHAHPGTTGTANAPHGHPAGGVPGNNAPHAHTQNVSANVSPGPGVRADYNTDAPSAIFPQGINTGTSNAPHGHAASPNGAANALHSHSSGAGTNNAPHSHTITTNTTGAGDAFDVQPNYVSVFYIIRIK